MSDFQRDEEWYEARRGRATASRFRDVMAKGRGGGESATRAAYKAQLVLERVTGQIAEGFTSAAMQWGIDNEPLAVLAYMDATGRNVDDAAFIQHPTLMAGASPDGLVGMEGLIEIKCPNSHTHLETLRRGTIPPEYIPQTQGQLWIVGADWLDFVSFDPRFPESSRLFVYRVERDEKYINELEAQVARFLEEVEAETEFLLNYEGTQ